MKNYSDSRSLVNRLMDEGDLDENQAILVLHLVSDYAKDQLPVLRGNIQLFVQTELHLVNRAGEVF